MSGRAVLGEYHAAVSAEQAYLGSTAPELVAASTLPHFGGVVASGAGLARNLDETKPLLSHRLAMSAYSTFSRPPLGLNPNDRDGIAAFHNDVVLPLAGIRIETTPTAQLAASREPSETCPKTEPTFIDALRQVDHVQQNGRAPRWVGPNHIAHTKLNVYADEQGSPLILQKRRDIRLGVTLAHMLLDDALIVPAGTFVAVDGRTNVGIVDEATHMYQPPSERTPQGWSFQTLTINRDFEIRPLRIGPWAYNDPTRRAFYGITRTPSDRAHYDRRRAKQVVNHTLDDFRAAADRIMELCA
ncbi:hypothetical protein KC957_01660 [Candidatus Saccharibacteria bacterium]|nr:hypothetical protein [Candidatus Saccharibacteria bacterium]